MKVISDVWIGRYGSDSNFTAVLEYNCEMIETKRYDLWLADLRQLNQSFYQFDDWLSGHVFSRTVAAGLKKEAVVVPDHRNSPPEFDAAGAGYIAHRKTQDDRIRMFTDIGEAETWLVGSEAGPPLGAAKNGAG